MADEVRNAQGSGPGTMGVGGRVAWILILIVGALLLGNTITLVSAIVCDKRVNAIGPFEMTDLGLVMVWGACAVTAPFLDTGRMRRVTSRSAPIPSAGG